MPKSVKKPVGIEKEWEMPDWMEKYRGSINNTGGNTVEECVNSKATLRVNMPMAILNIAVTSQVGLLNTLHARGELK